MQRLQKIDIFFNVVLPVIVGLGIYYSADFFNINMYIRNELPDGLWSYSLMSSMLIIWNRKINFFWAAITFSFCILFETLQYLQVIYGVGDLIDIITYFIFVTIALITNSHFLTTFKIKYEKTY